jgi:hypothetical protein
MVNCIPEDAIIDRISVTSYQISLGGYLIEYQFVKNSYSVKCPLIPRGSCDADAVGRGRGGEREQRATEGALRGLLSGGGEADAVYFGDTIVARIE